ncbi:MAG: hypothetical protein U5K33_06875 [Halofilum sp. (in: g-proteobacteria)]|nr:hypothetical protein [Halofilum sp. (in: g-proteobacteria)]
MLALVQQGTRQRHREFRPRHAELDGAAQLLLGRGHVADLDVDAPQERPPGGMVGLLAQGVAQLDDGGSVIALGLVVQGLFDVLASRALFPASRHDTDGQHDRRDPGTTGRNPPHAGGIHNLRLNLDTCSE